MENYTIDNPKTSVLLFPWLAHGHISPFLELGRKLTQRSFIVYLCSTPANLGSIKRKIGEKYPIKLVKLDLPSSPNFPPKYHTTNGLPPHLMSTLKNAYDSSKARFSIILKTLKPDLVIYDFLRPWPAEAAFEHNIPAVLFIATSATMTSYMLHAFKKPGYDFPFSSFIYFRDYEDDHVTLERDSVDFRLVMKSLEKSSEIVLMKGFKEMDGKFTNYLSLITGKKIVHVGPLVQDPVDDDEGLPIIQWLNKKKRGSTIFVSFGSEYFLSKEDFVEIAYGLMLSNVNFIWVVRFPVGVETKVEDELPLGFVENVVDKGLVVEGWAPQAKILGHKSVGGFVSHCGWNSVIESMKFGVPIIAMPMHLDQPLNARLVENVGVGVEVLRTESGTFKRDRIASVIRHVVVRKSGRLVRKKAKELSQSIREKGEEEIEDVAVELEKMVRLSRKSSGIARAVSI